MLVPCTNQGNGSKLYCTSDQRILHYYVLASYTNKQKQHNPPFSFSNVLGEAIKFINFINSQLLSTHFLLFCLAKCYRSKYNLFELQTELAMFFKKHHFHLRKQQTDKLGLFKPVS